MKTLYDAWLSEEAVSDKSQKIVNNIISTFRFASSMAAYALALMFMK